MFELVVYELVEGIQAAATRRYDVKVVGVDAFYENFYDPVHELRVEFQNEQLNMIPEK